MARLVTLPAKHERNEPIGASFSHGAYLQPGARNGPAFPPGRNIGDFDQTTVAADVSYAWRHWQVWSEVFFSRFEVPNVGDADTMAYYI